MFGLLRSLCTLIGFLVIAGGTLYVGRDWAGCWALESGLHAAMRRPVDVSRAVVSGQAPWTMSAMQVIIHNHPIFEMPSALAIQSAQIQLGTPAWSDGSLRIAKVALDVEEVHLVRRMNGELNLTLKTGEVPLLPVPWVINQLRITIATLYVHDYTQGANPPVQTRSVQIKDELFANITSLNQIEQIVVGRAVERSGIKVPGLQTEAATVRAQPPLRP